MYMYRGASAGCAWEREREREAAGGVWRLNWEYVSVIYLEDEVNSTLIKFADDTKLECVTNTIEKRYKPKWPRKGLKHKQDF